MSNDEQYAELMRDEEADYRYQQQVEEWQYYDHFKPLKSEIGIDPTSPNREVFYGGKAMSKE